MPHTRGYSAPFETSFGGACIAFLLLTAIVARSNAHIAASPRSPTPPPAWVAFTRAWLDIAGYTATTTVFERKGAQVLNMSLDYSFRKPSSVTVRIIKGPNAGVTLVWGGGPTMVAHRGSGFMAMFRRTLSLHDPLALTIRGSSIDQLSFGAILAHGRETRGMVSQRSGEVIKGVATDAVKLVATTSLTNTGLTAEVVEISKTTHFPVRVLGYEGRTLVRRIDFSNVKLAPNPGPSSTPIATPAASFMPTLVPTLSPT